MFGGCLWNPRMKRILDWLASCRRLREATKVVTKKVDFNRVALAFAVLLGVTSFGSFARARSSTCVGLADTYWGNVQNWANLSAPTGTGTATFPELAGFTSRGALALPGTAESYAGSTTVETGTLNVPGAISNEGSTSGVTVESGVTLAGTGTNPGLGFGTLPSGFTASDLLVYTGKANQVDLLVSASGFTDQFWDGTTTTGSGTINGGNGTWNNITTNWTNMSGAVNAPWQSGFAIFEGTAGTVTLGANINFIGAQFNTTGYVITAGGTAYTLTATQTAADGGTIINVGANVTATIAAPIVGPGEIVTTGAGTLILTGANTYSGGTTISAGTLQLGNGGSTGSIVGNVTDNGVFAIDLSDTYTVSGSISGSGSVAQIGPGTTILAGKNTYSGVTLIARGSLLAATTTAFSPNSQFSVAAGAVLDVVNFSLTIGSLTGAGTVTSGLGTPILTVGNDNSSTTFSGVIEHGYGSLALAKIGTGTLTLTGSNTYNGGTTISQGTLQLGADGTTGSILGNIVDNGALVIDRSNAYTFTGAISGTGSVDQAGKGTVILTGDNTYKGGTTVDAGMLQIGSGGTTGSIIGNVTDKTNLIFDRSDAYHFSGTISGSGAVEQSGAGTLTLSGTNAYAGGTTIDSGTLVVDSAQALGTGNVTLTGGVLTADPQPIDVMGNYFQGPAGTLQLTIAGASPGQYDYLNVSGTATLGGTLKLINQGFTPHAGDTLTLVESGGGVTGKFATFIDPYTTGPDLNTIDLVYSLHSVDLEFLDIVPPVTPPPISRITTLNFASFAQTPNELAAGELLDAVELNPRFGNLLSFFLSQSFEDLPGELALISPEAFSSFYEISFSGANIQRLNLENRLDEIRVTGGTFDIEPTGGTVGLQKGEPDGKTGKNPVEPVLQPVVKPLFDLWASGYGDFVNVDSDFNARGYRFTTSGFDLGFDYRFLDHFAVGVMGNYAYTWTDLRPGTIAVNSGRGGLYGSYFNGNFYVAAGVYGGYNTYDTNRYALFGNAIGNTDGEEWSGFISTGYDFHTKKNLTIGPVASLQYTDVYVTGFTEQGSLVPMSIHSASEESLRTDLGFRATYQWQVGHALIEPYFKAEWEHEFKYSALPVTASLAQFPGPDETFYGPAEGQDSAVISGGVSVQWTQAISTFVGYDGQLGRGRYSSNAVNGGVRVSW
jgi:fibronectin-binding autotransporter adhesin